MNVELLRKIAAVIQEKPRQFSIATWHKQRGKYSAPTLCELPKDKRVACGTTHCIAGWAQVLSPDRDCEEFAADDAQRLLCLDDDQANRLFYGYAWPKGFGGERCNAKQAAARIELFIETGGSE